MVVKVRAEDIVYTPKVSGIPANFIRQSLEQNGVSLDNIDSPDIDLGKELIDEAKAWKTIWSAGHGAGPQLQNSAVRSKKNTTINYRH